MRARNIEELVKLETSLLERSQQLLRYRRINWQVETRYRIYQSFERLAQGTRQARYPFNLYVAELEHPCESVIQISATRTLTGAIKRTTTHSEEFEERVFDTPIFEEGGVLVASQSVSGHVAIIVHPRKSERIKPKEEQIILHERLDPTDVTNKLLEKAIKRYLLYMRSTSLYGCHDTLSLVEKAIIISMKIGDIRYRYKLSRSLLGMQNEWAKIILAAIAALAIGYLTGSGK